MQKRIKILAVLIILLLQAPFSFGFSRSHSLSGASVHNAGDTRPAGGTVTAINVEEDPELELYQFAKLYGDEDLLLSSAFSLSAKDLKSGNYTRVTEILGYIADSAGIEISGSRMLTYLVELGDAYYGMGDFSSAEIRYQEFYDRSVDMKDTAGIANALLKLGRISLRSGDFDQSLEFNHRSLELSEKSGDSAFMANVYNNFAVVYISLERYDSAMSYIKKSGRLFSSLGDTSSLIVSLVNLGDINRKSGNYRWALTYDTRAYRLTRKTGNRRYQVQILESLGEDAMLLKDMGSAKKYFQIAYDLNKKENNPYLSSMIMLQMGNLFLKTGKTDSARIYMNTGMKEARSVNNKELLMLFNKLGADISEIKGDREEAYAYFKRYHEYYDSLNNEKTRERITEMEAKYRNKKKEAEISHLRSSHQILELKFKKDQLQKTLLLVVLGFGVIVLLLISFLYRKVYFAKLLVQNKNNELAEANATKNRLFSIVAHDLKNPLNAIVGFSSLLTDGRNSPPEKISLYADRIKKSGLEGFGMIEKLLEWSRLNLDDIHLDFQDNDLYDISVAACNPVNNYAMTKGIIIENHIPGNTNAFCDSYSIESVLRNLISNAVKYSPENSVVSIYAEVHKDVVVIRVTDTGTGIPEDCQDKILTSSVLVSLPGTKNEKGSGLGITLSREFILRNKGEIWFHSVPGKGTSFFFSLPVSVPHLIKQS